MVLGPPQVARGGVIGGAGGSQVSRSSDPWVSHMAISCGNGWLVLGYPRCVGTGNGGSGPPRWAPSGLVLIALAGMHRPWWCWQAIPWVHVGASGGSSSLGRLGFGSTTWCVVVVILPGEWVAFSDSMLRQFFSGSGEHML